MSRKLGWHLVLFLFFVGRSCFGQAEKKKMMYDSIPYNTLGALPVFHDYNTHAFFGYDDCTKFIDLKYGFQHKYEGQLRRISYRIMRYDWLNRRWSKGMRQRNGPNWVEAYYRDVKICRSESVFQNYNDALPDSAFVQIKNTASKKELLRIPPFEFLRYLSTTSIYSDANSELLEMRRNVKFLVTPQDKWVTKTDVGKLIQYIYSGSSMIRRACLCPDTVLQGQPTTLALEAFKLISLYRGFDYPTSFSSVSKAEVDELFRWWLEERKRP